MQHPFLCPGNEQVLYLVDISSFIFRAYHSVGRLTTRDGTPTGAVFGVANMLTRLVGELRPVYWAMAMDSPTPTFRREIYPEYKANRPPPPDDLQRQFPLVRELVEAFAIPILQRDGFEADDLIATATRRAREAGLQVVIVSGDKDLMQLVSADTVMFDTMRGEVFDEAAVTAKWGVPPARLGDLLALAGDSSDNIPGVPRIGPKTGAELLAAFGDLDALLARAAEVKAKGARENLLAHADQARLSRRLVALDAAVPIAFALDELRHRPCDAPRLQALLERLELKRLSERLFGGSSAAEAASPARVEVTSPEVVYETVADEPGLDALLTRCRRAGRFCIDLETTGVETMSCGIVGVALACEPGRGAYVPVAHAGGPNLPCGLVLERLAPLLADGRHEIVAQNCKFEDTVLQRHGAPVHGFAFDPMLASYTVHGDARRHNMDALAATHLQRRTQTYDEVTEKARGHQLAFAEVPVDRATRYAAEDAEVTLALVAPLERELAAAGVTGLYREVELPLAAVLARVERAGVALDLQHLGVLSRRAEEELARLTGAAHAAAGGEFNLGSPKQLQEILFDRLGLPAGRKTKTGYSTDAEVLEELAPYHELPRLLLEHRLWAKLASTYLDALPRLINPATGRVHTSFNQAVTATGRLSSSNPNLQNIPVRTDLSREIRRAFVAPPGHVLLAADYSQIELRLLAHLAGDEALQAAFRGDADVHERTARAIFGLLPLEPPTRTQRSQAKAINFGVIYGKGEFSLAKELGIPRAEAKRFIDGWFRAFPGVARYMTETIARAHAESGVRTILGRCRALPDLGATSHVLRQAAERMARNTPIQGSAADLLKVAMVRVDARLAREGLGARMILTVHDELVFEVPADELETTRSIVKAEMEGAMALTVPLKVDCGAGPSWADAH